MADKVTRFPGGQMSKFPDLMQRFTTAPDHIGLLVTKVEAKPQKGADTWMFTLHMEAAIGGEQELPTLPDHWKRSRATVLQARQGTDADGAEEMTRKRWQLHGKVTICPMIADTIDVDNQAANVDPCTMTHASLYAGEKVVRIRYRMVIIADVEKAVDLLPLWDSNIHVNFEPSPGQDQLSLTDAAPANHDSNVVEFKSGDEPLPPQLPDDDELPSEPGEPAAKKKKEEADGPIVSKRPRRRGGKRRAAAIAAAAEAEAEVADAK